MVTCHRAEGADSSRTTTVGQHVLQSVICSYGKLLSWLMDYWWGQDQEDWNREKRHFLSKNGADLNEKEKAQVRSLSQLSPCHLSAGTLSVCRREQFGVMSQIWLFMERLLLHSVNLGENWLVEAESDCWLLQCTFNTHSCFIICDTILLYISFCLSYYRDKCDLSGNSLLHFADNLNALFMFMFFSLCNDGRMVIYSVVEVKLCRLCLSPGNKELFLSQVGNIEYLDSDWHNRWLWDGCNHTGERLFQMMDF